MMFLSFIKNGYTDMSIMNLLVPSTAAELASATGFYYWKTKTNNVYEFGEKFIIDLVENEKIDSQSVVSISQAFFNSAQFNHLHNK